MKHALVRYTMDLERGLSKAVQDLDTEQMRAAKQDLASMTPTGLRRDLILELDKRLERYRSNGSIVQPVTE